MKPVCIFLIWLFIAVLSVAASEQELNNKWIRGRAECQILTQVSDNSLAKGMLGIDVGDPKLKETALCVMRKLNMVDSKDELKLDVIKAGVGDFFGAKTEAFNNECYEKKSTPVETAYQHILCFRKYEQTLNKSYGTGPKA